MNRRDLLKSSAALAAAVVGYTPEENKVVKQSSIRLSEDCRVDLECSGYPPYNYAEPGLVFGADEKISPEDLKARVEEIWSQHRLAEHLGTPKVVHSGWSCWTYQKPLSNEKIQGLANGYGCVIQ